MDAAPSIRKVPKQVRALPLGQRIRWARRKANISHDQLVARMGRSNRGHLIKIEQGKHVPRPDLREALADALGVPRDLFAADDDDEARAMPLSRDEFALLGTLMSRLGGTLVVPTDDEAPA